MYKNLKQQIERRYGKKSPFFRARFFAAQLYNRLKRTELSEKTSFHEVMARVLYGENLQTGGVKKSILENLASRRSGIHGTEHLANTIESAITASYVIPSKDSPIPIFVAPTFSQYVDAGILSGHLLEHARPFHAAYRYANFIENAHHPHDGSELADFGFELKMRELAKTDSQALDILKGPTASCLSALGLVESHEASHIFKQKNPVTIAYLVGQIVRLWHIESFEMTTTELSTKDKSKIEDDHIRMIQSHVTGNSDRADLPYTLAVGHAISAGVSSGFSVPSSEVSKSGPSLQAMRLYSYYVGDRMKERGQTVEEYLASGATDLDEFIFSLDAFDWLVGKFLTGKTVAVEDWIDSQRKNGIPSHFEKLLASYEPIIPQLRSLIGEVIEFTNLVDERWKAGYERDPVAALRSRFGHPTFVETKDLKPVDWIPGGQILRSGYAVLKDGPSYGVSVNLPIDANGRQTEEGPWKNVISFEGVSLVPETVKGLGLLARAASLSYDVWHVEQNLGLKKDSLYNLSYLSSVPTISRTGSTPDDATGIIRGHQFEALKMVEFGTGVYSFLYPTLRGKITAVRSSEEKLLSLVSAAGGISTQEIDLSNWRLSRMDDLRGVDAEHEEPSLEQGEILSRAAAETLQAKIRSKTLADGVMSFEQIYDFKRPALPHGRADALALYMERPGSYFRATGKGLEILGVNEIVTAPGPAKSLHRRVSQGSFMAVEYEDFALGEVNGFRYVARGVPGVLSRNPESLLGVGTSVISCNVKQSDAHMAYAHGFITKKMTHVAPGRFAVMTPCFILPARPDLKPSSGWLDMTLGTSRAGRRMISRAVKGSGGESDSWSLSEYREAVPSLTPMSEASPCALLSGQASALLANFMDLDRPTRQRYYNALMVSGHEMTQAFADAVWSEHENYETAVDEYLLAGDFSVTGSTADFLGRWLEDQKCLSVDRSMRKLVRDVELVPMPHGGIFRASTDYHTFLNSSGYILSAPGYRTTGAEILSIRINPDLLSPAPVDARDFFAEDYRTQALIRAGEITLGVDGRPKISKTMTSYLDTGNSKVMKEHGQFRTDLIIYVLARIVLHPTSIRAGNKFVGGVYRKGICETEFFQDISVLQAVFAGEDESFLQDTPLGRMAATVIAETAPDQDEKSSCHIYRTSGMKWIKAVVMKNRLGETDTARSGETDETPRFLMPA